jgi:hypothetical protein
MGGKKKGDPSSGALTNLCLQYMAEFNPIERRTAAAYADVRRQTVTPDERNYEPEA